MPSKRLLCVTAVLFVVACAAPLPSRETSTSRATPLPVPSATASHAATADKPEVSIAAGLTPRMRPEELAEQVIDRIHAMEREAGRVETPPRIIAVRAEKAADGIEWRVDAEGTFTSPRPRVTPLPVAPSGYFVISDADGSVLGFGFPSRRIE